MAGRAASPQRGLVTGLTLEGAGVLHPEGKRVLVPDALPGEEVDYLVTRRRPKYDEGRLLAVVTPSPDRVVPPCEYFGRCGGCALQHLAPAAQLAAKEATLLESLARIGGVVPRRVLPPVAGATLGYRRRVRFAARDVAGKGRVLVGFHERERPYVMDMGHCATAHPAIAALLGPLSALAGSLSFRHRLPQFELTAAEPLYYALPAYGLRFAFGPTDFIQVHAGVNEAMVDRALAELGATPADAVLDAFAGIGNFSLPVARRAARVVALEGAGPAVDWARRNAAAAGLGNVTCVVADLAGEGAAGAWTRERFRLAILDPPRAGARELLAPLAGTGVERLVYVSCHPGTLARDAGILATDHGFVLEAAGVLDMFPQTSHVESMAVFARGDGLRP